MTSLDPISQRSCTLTSVFRTLTSTASFSVAWSLWSVSGPAIAPTRNRQSEFLRDLVLRHGLDARQRQDLRFCSHGTALIEQRTSTRLLKNCRSRL